MPLTTRTHGNLFDMHEAEVEGDIRPKRFRKDSFLASQFLRAQEEPSQFKDRVWLSNVI